MLERGGMYDRGKDLNWKNMKDIGYIAAMGKAGGGRNETDPRFISLFCVFNMTFPSDDALFLIYNSILLDTPNRSQKKFRTQFRLSQR